MILEILFILFSLVIGYLSYPVIHHKRTMKQIEAQAIHLATSNREAFTAGWKAAYNFASKEEQAGIPHEPPQ